MSRSLWRLPAYTVAGTKGAALIGRIHKRSIHIDCIERNVADDQSGGGMAKYKAGLFLDNVFPLKISAFDIRSYLMLRNQEAMQKKVACLLPGELPHGAAVNSIEPHRRDGGSIVYFTFLAPQEHEAAAATAQKVVEAVNAHLASRKGRKWYDVGRIRALGVRGVPFTEDIVRQLPSKRVKVEFQGPDVGVEEMYKEFREFGRIEDITQQPSSSKDTPHWAEVHFTKLRGATSARNCVHGDVVGTTKLRVSYVKEDREHVVLQWLKEHSKFTIPLAAAALIAAIYAVFDPIREFFVENKITHRFDLSQLPLVGNVRRAAILNLLRRDTAPKEEVEAWSGLADQSARLSSILDEPPESFVIVTGPHGAGKTRVVEQATAHRKYRIVIDAGKLGAEHSELEQMTTLARQLGWWPVFNSIIGITNAIDLMVTATTGSNAGISATPASQVRKILDTLALVLSNIRRDRLRHADAQNARKEPHGAAGHGYAGPMHTVSPADIPVIVLENLMDKELKFTPDILEWAASVIEAGLAHCIVTTSNISGYHDIQRAQPHSTASLLSLDDASPMEAVTLLQQQLVPAGPGHAITAGAHTNKDVSAEENHHGVGAVSEDSIVTAAKTLGGRLEDLQLFVQKVKAGESAASALEDIIQRSITEVRKHAFADDAEVGQNEHTWTPEQFWYLLTELAMHEDVEYDRMRNSALFAGRDDALLGLAEAQLITMVYNNDRPSRIRAGRPVYYAAFTRIVKDPGFSSSMTVKMNNKGVGAAQRFPRKRRLSRCMTSAMAMIAASRESSGYAKRSSSSWRQGSDAKNDFSLHPEAFIAQAADAGGGSARVEDAQTASSRSWLGWLFGRSSRNQQGAMAQGGSGSAADAEGGYPSPQRPSAIAGIPYELQGRVQFLLQSIHASQLKIDRWDRECRARAECLATAVSPLDHFGLVHTCGGQSPCPLMPSGIMDWQPQCPLFLECVPVAGVGKGAWVSSMPTAEAFLGVLPFNIKGAALPIPRRRNHTQGSSINDRFSRLFRHRGSRVVAAQTNQKHTRVDRTVISEFETQYLQKRSTELLLQEGCAMAKLICRLQISGDRAATMASHLVSFLRGNPQTANKVEDFVIGAFNLHVSRYSALSANPRNVLRDNNLATMLVVCYLQQTCRSFLVSILRPVMSAIEPFVENCELDPMRLPQGHGVGTTSRNSYNLYCVCRSVLDAVLSAGKHAPAEMRRLCTLIRHRIETTWDMPALTPSTPGTVQTLSATTPTKEDLGIKQEQPQLPMLELRDWENDLKSTVEVDIMNDIKSALDSWLGKHDALSSNTGTDIFGLPPIQKGKEKDDDYSNETRRSIVNLMSSSFAAAGSVDTSLSINGRNEDRPKIPEEPRVSQIKDTWRQTQSPRKIISPTVSTHLNKHCSKRYSGSYFTPMETVISMLIFVRFFIPILTSPEAYGLIENKMSSANRRGLLLCAKVLAVLCNGVSFGTKETYLMPMNGLIREYRPRLRQFLHTISSGANNNLASSGSKSELHVSDNDDDDDEESDGDDSVTIDELASQFEVISVGAKIGTKEEQRKSRMSLASAAYADKCGLLTPSTQDEIPPVPPLPTMPSLPHHVRHKSKPNISTTMGVATSAMSPDPPARMTIDIPSRQTSSAKPSKFSTKAPKSPAPIAISSSTADKLLDNEIVDESLVTIDFLSCLESNFEKFEDLIADCASSNTQQHQQHLLKASRELKPIVQYAKHLTSPNQMPETISIPTIRASGSQERSRRMQFPFMDQDYNTHRLSEEYEDLGHRRTSTLPGNHIF
ncbi:hypothetical protein COEREDRAFT_6145 [Coemansia reversa NRRL 1564]|uniref:Mitochondrial escape protein 2 n=1 Tax=Coemansia reversa (strain ATCC 12441 / NRRL 1564) TaxID=763665 RepID=A0A2G5BJ01_COERN|nr:hypothetical protein COEREDRAFT_6145 [Coemansia reversa NRRL 1564]|eukprot:PIA18983.1 hypothetical protein COEREDRAFT_6145 [Coemansia reversa NRRL 1564]